MPASELDGLTEVLGRSVRVAGSEQRLRAMLPHDSLSSCTSALPNELVIIPHRAHVITEITFAVRDECSHAQALREKSEVLKGALRMSGPQQLDGSSQRVTRHAVAELREVSDHRPKVSGSNDPARSAIDVTRHSNTVDRIARDPSSIAHITRRSDARSSAEMAKRSIATERLLIARLIGLGGLLAGLFKQGLDGDTRRIVRPAAHAVSLRLSGAEVPAGSTP